MKSDVELSLPQKVEQVGYKQLIKIIKLYYFYLQLY
jgi:hypothetical protein